MSAADTSGVGPNSSTSENVSDEKRKMDQMLVEVGRDYAKYFRVEAKAEKSALEEELEDLLTRLDEFTSLVDMVRSDDALCLNSTLPEIYIKSKEIESLYDRIDKLERVVGVIKKNLDIFEEKVTEAENALGGSSVRKLLTSLQKPLFSKKSEAKKLPKFDPPPIFHTEELFMNTEGAACSGSQDDQKEHSSSAASTSCEEICAKSLEE